MRFILFLLLTVSILLAEVAKVSAVTGDASILRDGKTIKIIIGTKLEKKDIVITKNNSKLQIIFLDNTIITLGKNSALDISEYIYDTKNPKHSQTNLNFFKGAFKAITGNIGKINKEKFKLRTKSSTIGIRGTVIIGNQNMIACTQGAITVTSSGKTVQVDTNQITFTKENTPPSNAQTITSDNLETLDTQIEPEENSQSNISKSNDSEEQDQSQSSKQTSSESSESSSETTSSTSINQEDTSVGSSNSQTQENNLFSSSISDGLIDASSNIVQTVDNEDADTSVLTPIGTEYDMLGFFLGSNKTGIAGESFIQEDETFKAKRVDGVYSFDDSLKRVKEDGTQSNIAISKTKDFGSFDEPGVGNYSGAPTSSLGTLDFSYTNPSLNGNYTVYSDNVGEVFVGLHDSTNFDEMFVSGVQGNTNNLDNSKVYVYQEFAFLTAKKDSSNVIITPALKNYVGGTEASYEFYNPKTDSLTHYNINKLEKGAESFVSGSNESVVSYDNTYLDLSNNINHIYEKGDANINMLGTDLQALAININSEVYSTYDTTAQTVSETHDGLGVSFLNKDAMFDAKDLDTTGYTMKGYTSALVLNESTNARHIQNSFNSNNFSLTFKKDSTDNSYKIEGNLGQNTNNLILDFGTPADIGGNSAYYINQDLFGVATNTGEYNADYNLLTNTGYLVSVHDGGVDSDDNPLFLDDDSSWGYWTAAFDDNGANIYVDNHSTWVSGIINTGVINSVLSSPTRTTADFSGQVLGNVIINSTNIVENILVNSDNSVNLKFEFGNSTNNLMEADIKFKTTNTSWDLYLSNVAVSPTTGIFETTSFDGASPRLSKSTISGVDNDISSTNVRGQLYGNDSIKSVGGTINIIDTGNNRAKGIFKATKE